MVSFLGPILAQVVSLSVSDRTEARAIASDNSHVEASTRPAVGLLLRWKHGSLSFGYSPSLTWAPSWYQKPSLILFHSAGINANYVSGRNSFFVSGGVGYGSLNFQQQPLAGGTLQTIPTAPAGSTPPPVAVGTVLGGPPTTTGNTGSAQRNAVAVSSHVVRFGSLTANAGVSHSASKTFSYGGDAGYQVSGALDEADKAQYPKVEGPRGSVFARYGWGHRDEAASALSWQYSVASNGNSAWLAALTESWTHRLGAHTSTVLGCGVSGTRTPIPTNGTVVAWGVYPTFLAGVFRSSTLERGQLTMGATVSGAPALDLVTLVVDPRVSIGASTGWAKKRFFAVAAGAGTFAAGNANKSVALNTITGSTTFGYALGRVVSVDTGVRVAWQTYGGTAVIPFTYGAFVGMNFATAWPFR